MIEEQVKEVAFVFDLSDWDRKQNTFCQSLRRNVEHLPVKQPAGYSTSLDTIYMGPGWNFRSMIANLSANELFISGAFLRHDGKVVFTAGSEVDPAAELLFIALTRSSGWTTVRYENLDGSIVFASRSPRFLSDTINVSNAMGMAAQV